MYFDENIKEVLKKLKTSIDGLSSKEALSRINIYGKNMLMEDKKKSKLVMFFYEFKDPMIIILIIASIIAFIVSIVNNEPFTDSTVIIAIVILNACMGYFQAEKADKALESLKSMQANEVKVKRDGNVKIINSKDLVPGDILLLEAGDIVPADARIIKSSSLQVEEASLTGESIAVEKNDKKVNSNALLSERTNMVYSGTSVVYGTCTAVVCSTGMTTEFGKIAMMLSNKEVEVTPLQKKIEEISKDLSVVIMFIVVLIFMIGLIKEMKVLEILMLSLSLAVAAIPEGLPAIITITLSLGISSMAKKRAIVRKMTSVETLGCTQIICSDKTGTITQNLMTVDVLYYNEKLYKRVKDNLMLEMMVLNNDVLLAENNYIGDPTEAALYRYAKKYLDIQKVRDEHKRVLDIPFDSERKMMTTINEYHNKYLLITKGSFESVINKCSKINIDGKVKVLSKAMKEKLVLKEKELSGKAYRILAFGYRFLNNEPKLKDDLENNLIFSFMVCMIDPPREDIKESINSCKNAHIRPIMITGDSLGIGIAIAKKTGILNAEKEAILGSELEKYSKEELREVVKKYSVYARVTPEEKLMIVNAWKENGKVVAMTGDGVNDAPAIKSADIGIGMGITGTDVSKNVSDIILSDDSFSTIVSAVKEGRRIFDNIRNVIVYLLAGNLAEVMIVFIGMLFGLEIFIPIQLLYINLVTDSLPAIALAFEKEAPDIMSRDIRANDSKFFTPFLKSKIGISAILKTTAVLLVYFINIKIFDTNIGTTMAFFTLMFLEIIYAYSCRNLKTSVYEYNLLGNKELNKSMLTLLILNIIVFFTPLSSIFKIAHLSLIQYLYCLIIAIIVLLLDEISKPVIQKYFKDI